MTREELISVLVREGGDVAKAAGMALSAGADFEVWIPSASARELWAVWSWRQQVMTETGVTAWPGLANAVTRLHEEAEGRVCLGKIRTSRSFVLFLSDDLQKCVACM